MAGNGWRALRLHDSPTGPRAAVAGGFTYLACSCERLASADGAQLPGDPLLAMNNVGDDLTKPDSVANRLQTYWDAVATMASRALSWSQDRLR